MADTPNVIDNAAAGHFEIHTDAGVAVLAYVLRGDTVDLTNGTGTFTMPLSMASISS